MLGHPHHMWHAFFMGCLWWCHQIAFCVHHSNFLPSVIVSHVVGFWNIPPPCPPGASLSTTKKSHVAIHRGSVLPQCRCCPPTLHVVTGHFQLHIYSWIWIAQARVRHKVSGPAHPHHVSDPLPQFFVRPLWNWTTLKLDSEQLSSAPYNVQTESAHCGLNKKKTQLFRFVSCAVQCLVTVTVPSLGICSPRGKGGGGCNMPGRRGLQGATLECLISISPPPPVKLRLCLSYNGRRGVGFRDTLISHGKFCVSN